MTVKGSMVILLGVATLFISACNHDMQGKSAATGPGASGSDIGGNSAGFYATANDFSCAQLTLMLSHNPHYQYDGTVAEMVDDLGDLYVLSPYEANVLRMPLNRCSVDGRYHHHHGNHDQGNGRNEPDPNFGLSLGGS